VCLHEAADFTQKESTWVLVASRPVQRLDNHLHLFWFGKMCRIPETKFLMSGQNGNGLWWWLYNYSLSYRAVGIQWLSETLAATWLKGIFSHNNPCCWIKSKCLIASCSWRKEELPKCWYCVYVYWLMVMVQKCFVKLLTSVFHEQQSFSEAAFLCHICCFFISSVDLLLLLFHVFTYMLGCISA
jgi:hypothetical protein